MKTNKLKWEKMPSVFPGGKPFFWVSIPRGYIVVWNRQKEKWVGYYKDNNINLCEVDSEKECKKFIEKLLKGKNNV